MGFGIWDDEQERILTDEEIDEKGLYLDRRGAVMEIAKTCAEPKDVSERYKPLMKVGCG
jgi:hypothetical protein